MSLFFNSGIFSLNEFVRSTTKLAPDLFVTFNGGFGTTIATPVLKEDQSGTAFSSSTIGFKGGITSVSTSASTQPPGGGSCTIQVTSPPYRGMHTSYYVDNPDGTRTPYFQPLMEVKVYAKGRFLASPKAGEVGAENSPRYYVIFWGFITGINHSQSGANANFTLNCKDMLYWWNYQNVTITQSPINTKYGGKPIAPTGTALRFLNPWEIILNLFAETGFDNFVYPTFSNGGQQLPNESPKHMLSNGKDDPGSLELLIRKTSEYWSKRFGASRVVPSGDTLNQGDGSILKTYNTLEMFGMQGKLNLAETFTRGEIGDFKNSRQGGLNKEVGEGKASNTNANTVTTAETPRGTTDVDKANATASDTTPKEDGLIYRMTKDMSVLAEVTTDFGLVGKVMPYANFSDNMPGVEATTATKLEIANTATQNTHMEFYQDPNGTFVFKPPFYNMDTSASRIYRIMADDIININESVEIDGIVNGLEVTGPMLYLATVVRYSASHYDFGSIAKYGLRYRSMQLPYGNNVEELQALAVAEMSLTNAQATTASLEIPLRPEMRMGYPVYIDHLDCYYYVVGINHNFNFGSSASTTLTLTAKRPKMWDYTGAESEDGQPAPMRAYIYRTKDSYYREKILSQPGADSFSTEEIDAKVREMAKKDIQNSIDLADINDGDKQGSERPSEFSEEASPRDLRDKTSGFISTPDPGLYVATKSPAYWDSVAVTSSNTVEASGTISTNTGDRTLNELVNITRDSTPYTDVNGYLHIGGFPYGANLSISDTYDIKDLTQLGVGQVFDLKDILRIKPENAVDTKDPMAVENIQPPERTDASPEVKERPAEGNTLEIVTGVAGYAPDGTWRAGQVAVVLLPDDKDGNRLIGDLARGKVARKAAILREEGRVLGNLANKLSKDSE